MEPTHVSFDSFPMGSVDFFLLVLLHCSPCLLPHFPLEGVDLGFSRSDKTCLGLSLELSYGELVMLHHLVHVLGHFLELDFHGGNDLVQGIDPPQGFFAFLLALLNLVVAI